MLGPGGHLLLAFQVGGGECLRREHAYGHVVFLDVYRLAPDRVAELMSEAGLIVRARLIRDPDEPEKLQQAYLLAHKPPT